MLPLTCPLIRTRDELVPLLLRPVSRIPKPRGPFGEGIAVVSHLEASYVSRVTFGLLVQVCWLNPFVLNCFCRNPSTFIASAFPNVGPQEADHDVLAIWTEEYELSQHGVELWLQKHSHSSANPSEIFAQFQLLWWDDLELDLWRHDSGTGVKSRDVIPRSAESCSIKALDKHLSRRSTLLGVGDCRFPNL
jgi:hypothetical protein